MLSLVLLSIPYLFLDSLVLEFPYLDPFVTRLATVMLPYAVTAPNAAALAEALPNRPCSSPVRRLHNPSCEDIQNEDQIENMLRKIGGRVWGVDVHEICRMLSPRTVKPGVSVPRYSDHFDFLVDKLFFEKAVNKAAASLEPLYRKIEWPSKTSNELEVYRPFIAFLNAVIEACHEALDDFVRSEDIPPRPKRWYDKLKFRTAKERPVSEGADGVKTNPGIHGLIEVDTDKGKVELVLPVEVKGDLKLLVAQAATYAECLFDTEPYRRFALILAFDHKTSHVYFLIFHRTGLTYNRHTSVDISKPEGRKLANQLFMTLLLWENAKHAGLDMSISKNQILLSSPLLSVTKVIGDYRSVSVRGGATSIMPIKLGSSVGEAPAAAMQGTLTRDPPDTACQSSSNIKKEDQEPKVGKYGALH